MLQGNKLNKLLFTLTNLEIFLSFQAVISSKDYQAAQKHCESENGSLLEIKSQEENDFVSHFLLKHFTSSELWTGGLVTILAGKPINIWPTSQVRLNSNFLSELQSVYFLSGTHFVQQISVF